MTQLPITEKEISTWTSAPVFSPILCANLQYLGLDTQEFITHFRESFADMPFDYYDVKRKQWELLPLTTREGQEDLFKKYYLHADFSFSQFADQLQLDEATRTELEEVTPWRRRSVCSFEVNMSAGSRITRFYPKEFEQSLDHTDLRSLPRVFAETKQKLVDNKCFTDFLYAVAQYAQQATPHINIEKMYITAHFMSVRARQGIPGNNSPEGAHEDGADFIVSALVINRAHIQGGKSQVFEKLADGSMVNIFERELQPGEFLFQADTGEEKHYGNDLWHYVTPFYVKPPAQEAWRDIIGLDIAIVQPKM